MQEIGWTRPATSREDYIFILLFFSIIIYCVYYYVVLNEKLQQEKNARFRFIGEQSQAILSEIDRMMIIPLQISQKMKNNESNKISSNPSELLYSEFVQIKSLFKNINRLIIPENDSEIVSIKSCIEEAQKLLKFKKSHVTMNLINCEKSIEASHNRMVSVFFNLIMNSTDEFEKRNTHNPQINIECFDHSIVYTDNAVSNALDLNDFNQNTALTTYKSGIGIEMIRHDIEMMKLQITSYETNNNFSYMITGFR